MRFGLIFAAFVLASTVGASAQSYGTHLDGRPIAALAPAGTKAVVLYFIASDCPISNRTLPEMLRVRDEFRTRGVAFWFVYPNTTETPQIARKHLAAYSAGDDAGLDAILDPTGTLVALTHTRVTPQAAILIPSGSAWTTVYTGRIDDRYIHLGLERPQATQHFVEQVVAELLAGRPIEPAIGTPIGCAIINPQAPLTHTASNGSAGGPQP